MTAKEMKESMHKARTGPPWSGLELLVDRSDSWVAWPAPSPRQHQTRKLWLDADHCRKVKPKRTNPLQSMALRPCISSTYSWLCRMERNIHAVSLGSGMVEGQAAGVSARNAGRHRGLSLIAEAWEAMFGVICITFLPAGFPSSVSPEYARFQLCDSAQASECWHPPLTLHRAALAASPQRSMQLPERHADYT